MNNKNTFIAFGAFRLNNTLMDHKTESVTVHTATDDEQTNRRTNTHARDITCFPTDDHRLILLRVLFAFRPDVFYERVIDAWRLSLEQTHWHTMVPTVYRPVWHIDPYCTRPSDREPKHIHVKLRLKLTALIWSV